MQGKPELHERLERTAAQRIAGLAGWYEPPTYPEIADMWKRFGAQLGFAGQLGAGETIGVFRNREPSIQGFEHLAGVRVTSDAHIPLSFEVWDLPPQAYLVFRQMLNAEPLHLQMMVAQALIGQLVAGAGYERLIAPDLQVYPANFRLQGGWVEHWIPVDD
jgi:predicted transcriptional regulator YdeE